MLIVSSSSLSSKSASSAKSTSEGSSLASKSTSEASSELSSESASKSSSELASGGSSESSAASESPAFASHHASTFPAEATSEPSGFPSEPASKAGSETSEACSDASASASGRLLLPDLEAFLLVRRSRARSEDHVLLHLGLRQRLLVSVGGLVQRLFGQNDLEGDDLPLDVLPAPGLVHDHSRRDLAVLMETHDTSLD
eukprot:CAMPEP_0168334620 /NCGR_PEP_ID=MMETSP0213-20121227/10391_1 /TAXON_ID=151035 /ORGANISM="Euplotes harpa, Strain FSP1.4" /LENGTH=198 /DNA_ID=CAMNT_0008339329 /DNA_START=162 /DNA_END=758 /DNA_ORIENTATION=-